MKNQKPLKCNTCRHALIYQDHVTCNWQIGNFNKEAVCNLQEYWNPYRNPNNDKDPISNEYIKPQTVVLDGKIVDYVYASYEEHANSNSSKGRVYPIDWVALKKSYLKFLKKQDGGKHKQ